MLINVPLAGVDRRAVDTCTVNADSFLSIYVRRNQSARYLGVSHVFSIAKQIAAISAGGL